MERAARIFAIRVLLLHVLGFVLLLIFTGIGVRNAYDRAQEQAIEQAGLRQQLVAQQTARGIENYFTSVLDSIRLLTSSRLRDLSSTTTQSTTRPVQQVAAASFLDAVWQQIEPRASHLFAYRIGDETIVRSQQRPDSIDGAKLLPAIKKELAKDGNWGISNRISIDGFSCSLVWITVEDDAPFAVVAVVPVDQLGTQFFDSLADAKQNIGAGLYDGNSVVVYAWDPSLIGVNVQQESLTPDFRRMMKIYNARPAGGVERIENVEFVKGQFIERGIVAFEPVTLSPDCTWYVSVGSTFAEAGGLVNEIFAGTLFWAPILLVVFTGVMVSTAVTLIRSRSRLERFRHQMLTKELAQARQIQLSWLPKARFQGRGLDVFAMNAPASHVSGDFYNYFPLRDGREAVVIGDVTGHGLAAAFLMATTQMLIRSTLTRTGDLVATLNEVNHELCNQAFSGQFVTLLLVLIDQESQSIEVINAGHPPPILVDDGRTELLKTKPQLVLGVEGDTRYYVQRFPLPDVECTLLLYTDGIVECRNEQGERFSMEKLRAGLEGASELPEELMTRVMQVVDNFRGGEPLTDDATAVAMRITSVAMANQSGLVGASV